MSSEPRRRDKEAPIIWTADAHGRLEWVNERWYEFTGLSETQTLHDKGGWDAVHPDDRGELARRWGEALATSQSTEIEYRIRNARGEHLWHFGRIEPVRDLRGAVVRWMCAVFDVDEQRATKDALRATERRFELVFQMSPQPLAITREADGRFLTVNAALAELFACSRDEMIGKSSVELGLWTAEERTAFLQSLPGEARARRSVEVAKRTKDGRVVRVVFSSARCDIDGVPCLVNAVTDVTVPRATEDALRNADRHKDEFLALLSHELRNPLTPILTSARILERRVDAVARQDVDVIVRQVKHLVRLVDDLLDMSRVARGFVTLAKARLNVAMVVSRAIESTSPLFQERGHRLDVSIPATGLEVEGDEVRLTQVVDNLLSNAARYTPPSGVVSVTGSRENGWVVLRVRDSGVGIDPALLPNVFDTLVQGARGPDRAEGGLGIGLSLVRTLTELHGGTATAHSDGPGQGSEFTVRLPAYRLSSGRLSSGAATARGPVRDVHSRADERRPTPPGTRVLLVDDHRDVVQGLSRLLSTLGCDVRAVENPRDAIAMAELFQPQIAILDIGLPTMDGHALACELRMRLAHAPPKLIALTGYGQAGDRERSMTSGFALHLVKPIDVDELSVALAL